MTGTTANDNAGSAREAIESPSLRTILDAMLDPHIVLTALRDVSGRIVDFRYDDVNTAACEFFRISRHDVLGHTLQTMPPGLVGADALSLCADVIETGFPLTLDDNARDGDDGDDGETRYNDVRAVRAGESLLLTLRDATQRHLEAEELAASAERFRLLAENAYDVIWTMGVDGSITYVSPSVERVRGITPDEAMAQSIDQIHPPESAALVAHYFGELYAAMAAGLVPPRYHGEREYFRKDGSIMLGELDVIPQVNANGQVVQILGVTRDISERRQFEEELARLAKTDPLTGVWNRREGERLLATDLADSRRYQPATSLLMVDLDHFKVINDTHGHHAGDRVLRELTGRLTGNLRDSDVLVRWGGEEFIILMRHCTIADALAVGEKLRALVAATPFEGVGTVTVSIGAAELEAEDDITSWLARADQGMYEAKRAGRNRVCASGSGNGSTH